eukprot:evm.model.scf_173.9 EVM.evm.TU.scf_173.9   scf_173:100613-101725(+)
MGGRSKRCDGYMAQRGARSAIARWLSGAATFFGLQFADPELEREYETHVTRSLLGFDRVSLVIRAAACMLFACRLVQNGTWAGPPGLCTLAILASNAVEAVHANGMGAALQAAGSRGDPSPALRGVVVSRVVHVMTAMSLAALLTPVSFSALKIRRNSLASVAFFKALDSGALPLVALSPFHPLMLKHYLPFVAALASWYLLKGADCACQRVLEDPAVTATMTRLWSWLSEFSRRFLSAVFMSNVEQPAPLGASAACCHMGLLFLFMGLVVSVYVCSVFEYSSRRRFLDGGADSEEFLGAVEGGTRIQYVVVIVFLTALAWEITTRMMFADQDEGCGNNGLTSCRELCSGQLPDTLGPTVPWRVEAEQAA